jgi:hypothetical protein
MLTGDATPSDGRAFLAGRDIATEPQTVRRMMGKQHNTSNKNNTSHTQTSTHHAQQK